MEINVMSVKIKSKLLYTLPLIFVSLLIVVTTDYIRDYYQGYENVPEWVGIVFWVVVIISWAVTGPLFMKAFDKKDS